eukprot:scaffold109473_cov33-Tisochrysis_lutea.AAC.2
MQSIYTSNRRSAPYNITTIPCTRLHAYHRYVSILGYLELMLHAVRCGQLFSARAPTHAPLSPSPPPPSRRRYGSFLIAHLWLGQDLRAQARFFERRRWAADEVRRLLTIPLY